MKAQLDTPSREAFEHYREAISCLDTYRASGNKELVEKGDVLLDAALNADPQWTRPKYLKSILEDLKGDPQAAIEGLERWKDISDSSFDLEVKFNLGAAHYHRYKENHLNEAETLFQEVKSKAADGLQPLALLASSSLAQVYAMRVLLKKPEEFQIHKPEAKKWYDRCISEADNALERLKKWKASRKFKTELGESWVAAEIEWAANNAKGFAGSFWTDHLEVKERIPILQTSIFLFQEGLKLRPNHWATLSNLASAKMRLGYATRVVGEKEKGEKLLTEALHDVDLVLTPEVRPNYAFALFERGRILRLSAKFEDAIHSLEAVLSLPENLRDVSPKTINPEIELAKQEQTYFLRQDAY